MYNCLSQYGTIGALLNWNEIVRLLCGLVVKALELQENHDCFLATYFNSGLPITDD